MVPRPPSGWNQYAADPFVESVLHSSQHIATSNNTAISAANQAAAAGLSTWKIITIGVSVFIFLVIIGVLLCCCCTCRAALDSPAATHTRPLTAKERRRERRRQDKERLDEIDRGIREQREDEARINSDRLRQGW